MFNTTPYQHIGEYNDSSLIVYFVITDVFLCVYVYVYVCVCVCVGGGGGGVDHFRGNAIPGVSESIAGLKSIN
jgi:hypothetical protein